MLRIAKGSQDAIYPESGMAWCWIYHNSRLHLGDAEETDVRREFVLFRVTFPGN